MVRAAADWRRIGLTNIPQSVLDTLAPHYLPAAHRHHPGETPEDARGWATERVDQVVQLLEITETDTVRCSTTSSTTSPPPPQGRMRCVASPT